MPVPSRHWTERECRRSVKTNRGVAVSDALGPLPHEEVAYDVCDASSASRNGAARDPQLRDGAGDFLQPGRAADRPAAAAGHAACGAARAHDVDGHVLAPGQADSYAADAG